MIRVHVICEGQTEEMFVKEVLARHFRPMRIQLVPTLIGTQGKRGGNVTLKRLSFDVCTRLQADRQAYCTTFFDYYGLPDNFPGKYEAGSKTAIREKALCITDALVAHLHHTLEPDEMHRFIPYIQMHEFEALLFSSPAAFARGINRPHLAAYFQKIRDSFATPEDINDSPVTAPSKRVTKIIRSYEKPLNGTLGAMAIGLDIIRKECVLFDEWISALESLKRY